MTSHIPLLLSYVIFGLLLVFAESGLAGQGCERPVRIAVEYQRQNVLENPRVPEHQSSRMLFSFFDKVGKQSNCKIEWIVVPRARGLLYFRDGRVDMIYAVQTEARNQLGYFLRLFDFHVSLIVLGEHWSNAADLNDLANTNLQFNFVRGFDYGSAYRQLKSNLELRKHAEEVADVETIARKMKVERVHATIMAGTLFVVPAQDSEIVDKILIFSLPQLGRLQSGIYLSRSALSESDRLHLEAAIKEVAKSYRFRDFIESSYPRWSTKGFVLDDENSVSRQQDR